MILYAVVLGLIVLTLLGVSLARLGRVKTKADYLVAGRSLPAFVLVFTLLSSWIGSGSLLGGAENAYKHGFAALWQAGGGWAGLLLIYFIAPRARKFAQFTIPDLLEVRYNQTARVLGVIAVLFTYTAITSYQFIGGGDILHLIFPQVTARSGQVILACFVSVFTAIAGMGSVAYMDVVIGLLATFTMITALPVLVHLGGGWGQVRAALPASHFKVFGDLRPFQSYYAAPTVAGGAPQEVQSAFAIFLPTCLLMLGNQSMYQKFFSARSERAARRATVGWLVGTLILESIIVAIAVVGSAMYKTGEVHARPREVLAYTAVHAFGGWSGVGSGARPLAILGALLVGAIFAKVVSTANNYLFSPATNLVNDIFVRYMRPEAGNKQVLLVSRLMVVGLGAWALYQSLGTTSVLQESLYAYTIYAAALTPVILAAFFWRRATAQGAVASIAAGTVTTVSWGWITPHLPAGMAATDAIVPALVVSVLSLLVVSLMTAPPSESQLRQVVEDGDIAARA
ncbi:MAG: sodium:solute symporter family protein [Acidobacteriaceae bacterium]